MVDLDRHARLFAQQIDLHPSMAVERDRELDVQAEAPSGAFQRLESAV